MSNYLYVLNAAKGGLVGALTVSLIGLASYLVLEPVVSRSAEEIFEVSQSITAEIAFYASTTDVVMSPSIPGISGGYSNGAATAIVTTNSTGGYYMTLEFSSSTAMNANTSQTYISNYTPTAADTPDFNFGTSSAGQAAEFAYSVTASTSADVDPTFLSNGTNTCGTGASNLAGTCWFNASTSGPGNTIAERIVDRGTATAATGATTTIHFRVLVPANPNPVLSVDTYVATATLTAVAQ